MKQPSYAVVWREGDGPLRSGKLDLVDGRMTLEGSGPEGALERRSVPYADLIEVRVGRSAGERLGSRRTIILEQRAGPPIVIGEIEGLGSVFDIGLVLAELLAAERPTPTRVVVVVPLKKGRRAQAQELIRTGAPFDPEMTPLEAHSVFVTDREVVFLFEGRDVRRFLEGLVRTTAAWNAAAAWKDCLSGRPRIADEEYTWFRRPGLS